MVSGVQFSLASVTERFGSPVQLGKCDRAPEYDPAPVRCQIGLCRAQHRHQLIALGAASLGARLNRQSPMMTQELAPQVAQVLPCVELEVPKWPRGHLPHDGLKIAAEVLHSTIELRALRL